MPKLRVVIGEGEMDFCAWVTVAAAVPSELPTTLGVFAGSWTLEHASKIPDGTTVVIATHADKGGEFYATQIVETLKARIEAGKIIAKRWKP